VGEAITLVEIALTIMVIFTALYAPKEFSDRAFRLLPWATVDPRCTPWLDRPRSVSSPAPLGRDSK
jgi:hypothetical protein